MNKFRWIKPTVIGGTSLIVLLSVFMALYVSLQKRVILSVNGEERDIDTFASTVNNLLMQQDIILSNHDYISHDIKEKVKDGMKIEYKRAVEITMVRDGVKETFYTTSEAIKDVLKEKKVNIGLHDHLSHSLDAKVENGLSFVIETGKKVVFEDGVKEKKDIWTISHTPEEFLKEQHIILGEHDRIETPEGEIEDGQVIRIVRVEEKQEVVEKDVAFATVTKKDEHLSLGVKKIIQKGEMGKKKLTYSVMYENGKEVKRNLMKEEVAKDTKNEVVAVGEKKLVATVSRGSEPASGKEMYVTATAYTAYCNGCSGKTATGIDLRANPGVKVVAVDSSIIPLGSKIWVEGYGYAVAGDTGGAIKGNKIDVFIPNEAEMRKWGRKKVKIRIL